MQRVKSFEATGLAPNGRLYAGDLNAIQDAAAGKADFTQTIDLATLRVGETGLQLLKYGPGEARITGALRTDGILRGLGGLFGGTFSTAQRDALAQADRPYGLIILNTTTNLYEFNAGTAATPDWRPFINTVPATEITGALKMWPMNAAPAGYLICDGQAVSRTTYSALSALLATQAYPYGAGDGSTTFNLPDLRGRMPVGMGTHGDVDSVGENEGEALGARRPKHRHVETAPGHTHNIGLAGFTGLPGNLIAPTQQKDTGQTGTVTTSTGTAVTVGPTTNAPSESPAFLVVNFIIKT